MGYALLRHAQRASGGVVLAAGLSALTVALAMPVAVSAAVTREVRLGPAPPLPFGAQLRGSVPAGRALRLTVALRPRDPAALAAYASAVADPASPLFHHYLRPRMFARRFAPTAAQRNAVIASLRAHGLEPASPLPNGLDIPVWTTIGGAERAFSLGMAELSLAGGHRAVVATAAPAIDRSVAGLVQAVVGLNGLEHPQPLRVERTAASRPLSRGHVATGGPQPCADASSAAAAQSAYTADQIASAYEFSGLYRQGDQGQGVTIALYELESDDPPDIATYQRCYGTHAQVDYLPVDGGAGTGPGSGEAAFDIEQVIGLAPGARLLVYQGPNSNSDSPGSGPYDTDAAIISQDRAQIVSTSWGQCEPIEGHADAAAENDLFQEAAVQGQTLVSASGDTGSEDCYGASPVPDTQLAVDDPASQPFVTGVGGTTLATLGPPPSETTWNNGGNASVLLGIQPGAGGGGISSLWTMPLFQSSASSALHVFQSYSSAAPCQGGATDCRQVPDVSADADPDTGYLIYYNGSGTTLGAPSGWQSTGGTSGAAPLWAAVVAVAEASRACGGTAVGFANPVLYRLAGADQARYFNDVSTGNNDFTGTSGGRYPAGAGFDMATGLGSPRTAALAPGLCQQALRLSTPPARWSFVRARVSMLLHATDAPGAGLRVAARGLPQGLSLASGGRIVGVPRRIGGSQVTVSASDAAGSFRATQFTWTITGRPHLMGVRLRGLTGARGSLSITALAGRDEPALRTLTIALPKGLRVAGLRGLRVTGAGDRPLPHSASTHANMLTVRLAPGSTFVSIRLARGLTPDRTLVAAARAHQRLRLPATVTLLDAASGRTGIRIVLRPAG